MGKKWNIKLTRDTLELASVAYNALFGITTVTYIATFLFVMLYMLMRYLMNKGTLGIMLVILLNILLSWMFGVIAIAVLKAYVKLRDAAVEKQNRGQDDYRQTL